MPKSFRQGKRFGQWTILRTTKVSTIRHEQRYECQCDCGKIRPAVRGDYLHQKRSTGCGCFRRRPDSLKNLHPKEYQAWNTMKTACTNSSHQSWKKYGALGITVCPQWVDNFEQFLSDMGQRPEGTTLQRVDPAAGFTPQNSVWQARRRASPSAASHPADHSHQESSPRRATSAEAT